jgi:hypothetical protein
MCPSPIDILNASGSFGSPHKNCADELFRERRLAWSAGRNSIQPGPCHFRRLQSELFQNRITEWEISIVMRLHFMRLPFLIRVL